MGGLHVELRRGSTRDASGVNWLERRRLKRLTDKA